MNPLLKDAGDYEAWAAQDAVSNEEASEALSELSSMDALSESFGSYIADKITTYQERSAGTEKVSAVELQKRFPEVADIFQEDDYPVSAAMKAEKAMKRMKLEQTVQAGDLSAASKFGTSVWATMTDPGELILNVGLGVLTAGTGTIARTLGVAGVRGRVALGIGEAVVGAGISEAGVALNKKNIGLDYELQDAAINLTAAGVLGAGGQIVGEGIGYYARTRKAPGRMAAMPSNVAEAADEIVRKQVDAGKVPDPRPVINQHILEMTDDGGGKYKFEPVDDFNGRQLFAPAEVAVDDLAKADTAIVGDYIGPGTYLTDNPYAANSIAARQSSEVTGVVSEVFLEKANLLNLDSNLDQMPDLAAVVGRLAGKEGVYAKAHNNAFEVIEAVSKSLEEKNDSAATARFFTELHAELKTLGYDGMAHSNKRHMGVETKQQNTIVLFDRSKAKFGDAQTAQRAQTAKLTPEEIMQADAQQRNLPEAGVDVGLAKNFDDEVVEAPVTARDELIGDTDKALAEVDEQLDGIFADDVEAKKALDTEVSAERGVMQKIEKAMKAFAECKIGGGV